MNLKQLPKKMWMAFAVLFCSVVSAQAAEITYSLTTHVDGRTITGVASVDEGASLEDNMPQDLWRGYTTYKYYSDEALTQEITTAPAENTTVYVDYVFDPPFLMSNDNKTVWNYMRNYVFGGSTQRIVYYERGYILTERSTLADKDKYEQHWAFYGDGYDFKIKSRLTDVGDPWLVWTTGSAVQLGAKPELGWQIYANAASTTNRPGGTVSLGRPDNKDLIYMPDLGLALKTQSINRNEHKFDSHNQLVAVHTGSGSQATQERNELWLYAFFAAPSASSHDIWHVTYKIQKEDGTWYDDIVIQKSSINLTPSWPVEGFKEADGCEYDYFYTDATFTEKFEGAMPNDRNTTLYIKETKAEEPIEYVSEPWKTLVIPFDIEDLQPFFGLDDEDVPAVDVLELQEIQDGVITSAGDQDFYRCKLIFNPVSKIEAYKPYLIRVNKADPRSLVEMYTGEGQAPCEVTTATDPANPGISVSMEGTLEPNGSYMDASDGLHFYFGYDATNKAYNFYRVSAQIPKNRCWFYVNDERASGAKLNVSFDMNAVTGINQTVVKANAKDGRIYNINGQQVKNTLQKGIYIVNGKKVIVK